MHAEQSAAKLASCTRFFAVARAIASIEQRQIFVVDDFVSMKASQRRLGRANQHDVFAVDEILITFLVALRSKARTARHSARHHMRYCHRRKSFRNQQIQRILINRILQQHQIALDVVEFGASHLGAALKIEPAALRRKLKVISCRLAFVSPRLNFDAIFLAAQRYVLERYIRHGVHLRLEISVNIMQFAF